MKHVAILAYYYLPANTSGVQRVRRMAKFLPESGYDVTVVTTSEQGVVEGDATGVWTPGADASARAHRASSIYRRVQRVMPYNDRLPWVPYAVEAVRSLHARRRLDAVISTAPPVASHLAALSVRKSLALPWVADFRDPLLGNPSRDRAWGLPYDRWLERRIAINANAVVTVTDQVADEWKRRYPDLATRIHVIWNGFDPSETVAPPVVRTHGPRILTHAGFLYRLRCPWALLESMDRLVSAGRLSCQSAVLQLIGEVEDFDGMMRHPAVARLVNAGCLRMDGKLLPRQDAIRLTSESDYLLLIDIVNLDQVGYTVPAKIFDYLRTGRPILALTDRNSPVDRILSRSGVPVVSIYHNDPPALIDEKVLRLFAAGSAPVTPSPWFFENFDGRRQMQSMAALLDGLTGRSK